MLHVEIPIAVEALNARIPDWAETWLLYLGIGAIALACLWIVSAIAGALHRRAYNLTKAETASARHAPEPAFLKVDHDAREEAIRRGDDYVRPADRAAIEEKAAAEAAAPPGSFWRRWGLFSRIGIVVIALAHIGVAVVSAAGMVQKAEEMMQHVSSLDCLKTIVSRYWLGFCLGGIVVVAEAVRLIGSMKKKP
jgi:uncharacterized membrane protein